MTPNRYRPTQAAALIVSPDPLGGALLAAAVELIGVVPSFPFEHETARDALLRGRPSFLLIDCDDSSASDESLIGPAMMTGARVFVFGSARATQMLRHVAIRLHVGTVVLPRDTPHLASILSLAASRPAVDEPRA